MSPPKGDVLVLARGLKDLVEVVALLNRRLKAADAEIEDLKGRVYDLESDVRELQ